MKTSITSHKKKIIGRIREQKLLKEAFNSSNAELIAVYGRRRIGKTYLIKTFFDQEKCYFDFLVTFDELAL